MRILQINSVYGYGSTGRIVENLHKAIQESGNESFVIYGRGDKSNDKNVFRIGNKIEQAIELAGTRLFNKHGHYSHVNTHLIINKIKEIKPDIVQLHNLHGYYINFIKLIQFLKHSQIEIVWLLHDSWLISGSSALKGGLEYNWDGAPNINELKNISSEYPSHSKISSFRSHKNFEIKKKLLSDSNITFVTPSNWLSTVIKKTYLKNNKVYVIHNGIDTEKFNIMKISRNSNKKNILGVANVWEESKGLEYFDKLANDLDDEYTITIVGITDEQAKKLNTKINCIRRTTSIEELVCLYNKADLFVNPTLFDNFPTVNIESQACGTPVITFDAGGSGESIIEGKTGTMVPPGDYNRLLNEIVAWPLKSVKTSKEARRNAIMYSIEKMKSNYIELYNEVLESK